MASDTPTLGTAPGAPVPPGLSTGASPALARRRGGLDFSRVILWLVVIFLIYQIIVPLAFLLWGTMIW